MSTPDFFNTDAFSLTALTTAINEPIEGQNVGPTIIDDLFNEEGISEQNCYIEMQGNTLSLVPSRAYGSPGDSTTLDKRKAKSFNLIHLPTSGAVLAAEVQGVRAFGTESTAETIEAKRDKVLQKMRMRLETTIRYHRMKALQGTILDADGSTVLLNVFTEFGVTQQTKNIALGTATTNVKKALEEAKELAEDALGDSTMIVGWRMYCGRDWFNAFVTHAKVEEAYQFYDTAFASSSQAKRPFMFADVEFHKVYGSVGGKLFIPAAEAYLVPVTMDMDTYITRFGPADYNETINTMGLPFYAKAEVMKFGKGVELEAQSNALSIPTCPRSIIKMTKS